MEEGSLSSTMQEIEAFVNGGLEVSLDESTEGSVIAATRAGGNAAPETFTSVATSASATTPGPGPATESTPLPPRATTSEKKLQYALAAYPLKRLDLIGRGSSSYVYRSIMLDSLTLCAEKIVIVGDTNKKVQLMRELESLRKLIHKGGGKGKDRDKKVGRKAAAVAAAAAGPDPSTFIVSLLAVIPNPSDGTLSICLEHMDGGSLQDLMKTGPQSSAVMQGISRQLFAGLAHLHSLRIIHRDVKPSNCLINSAGCVKLADFGLARTLGANSLAESFLGTYEFMSPERVAGGSYSFASDVWALGLTLHAVAIGEYPYRAVGGKKQRKPKRMGYWALINAIQEQETPLPPSPPFDFRFRYFIQAACEKMPLLRPSAAVLLRHPFLCDAVSDVTQEQADKEIKEAVEGSVAWLVRQVRLGAGETEAEIDASDPAPEGEDEQEANPDVEVEQEDDEEKQEEEEEEQKKKERKPSAPVVFTPTLIEAMTAAEAAEVADAWARYAAARLVTQHLRASEGEAAAASAAATAVGAGVGGMGVPTPPPQANRSNQQRDASSALDDTAAEAASLSAPAAPAVQEHATPNDKRGKIRLEEEEEEQRRFKAAASRFDVITTGSVSAASVDALARDISCDPALLRTAFHAAVGDIRMAVMRAIAEGGVGLDWTKETAVEEQMGRQGGLRLQSTLSKIRDWVPPPPESESESDSEVEDEEEERGDTDDENLLFSDDDCVVTSGEEDSSDSEGEQEKGPVLSAAEVLAAREALQGLATNGSAAPAAPASLASMKRMLGGPPAVPPRVGEAASSNGSKLPPVAGARRGRGGGRITSRVKKV